MQFLLTIILSIFCTSKLSSAERNTKHVYFQIDEFIKQLMTSAKFEELADIIAEKAAQKIKYMEEKPSNTNPNILRISTSKQNVALEAITHKPTINKDYNDLMVPTKNRKQKSSKTKSFGKIDTQAFLKKHFTSNELELNFKRLTEELEKRYQDDTQHIPKAKPRHDEKQSKRNKRKRINKTTKQVTFSNNIRNDETEENKEDNNLGRKIFHSNEEKKEAGNLHEKSTYHENSKQKWSSEELKKASNSDHSFQETEIKRDSHKGKFYSVDGDSAEMRTSVRLGGSNDNNFEKSLSQNDQSIITEENMETNTEISLTSPLDLKEVFEIGLNRAHSHEISVTAANQNITENTNALFKPTKRKVRVENGQIYTYNSSPDYAEYHERRANILQSKPKPVK